MYIKFIQVLVRLGEGHWRDSEATAGPARLLNSTELTECIHREACLDRLSFGAAIAMSDCRILSHGWIGARTIPTRHE